MKSIVCLLVCMLTVAIVPGTAGAQESDCPATRLSAGGQGIVTPGASNRIRSTPSTDGELLGNIPSGGSFDLLEGPECSGGFLWWRVNYDGLEGWTVEGNADGYFVDPVTAGGTATPEAAATPTAGNSECTLPTRLAVGREGETTSGTPSRLRDAPSASGAQIGQIDPQTAFDILDGPVCEGGINWWQVEVNGTTGWTAEGVDGEYFIELIEIVPTPTPEYTGIPDASDVSWNADGTLLAVASADGVYLFSAADFGAAPTVILSEYHIDEVAFSPSEPNTLAVIQNDGEYWWAAAYDIETGETLNEFVSPRPVMFPHDLVYSADGSLLALNDAGTPVALDTETYATASQMYLDDYSNGEVAYLGAYGATISPDGQWLGAVDVRVMAAPFGGTPADMRLFDRDIIEAFIATMAFSPDSTHLAVGDAEGNIQQWEVATGERTSFIRGAPSSTSNAIYALAYTADGGSIVTAEGDPQAIVRVFNAATLQQQTVFSGGRRAGAAKALALSPDGAVLAVIFDDTVRIIETGGYTQVGELVLARP